MSTPAPTPYLDRRREVFQRALDLPAAERDGYLDSACKGDSQLFEDVRSLLAAADDDDFLAKPAAEEVATHTQLGRTIRPRSPGGGAAGLLAPDLGPGSRVASYTILRVLGSGGMGVVYAAEQDSPRREVALKVILPGLIAPTLLRRFTHEAHALGLLQHPGIARVYEAGTEGAGPTLRPYLAMELVRGLPLGEFLTSNHPDTDLRLELFAKVCDAVHHAHQRGVIHRDLKPANILVEWETPAAPPQPKILDFGVARILSADANVTTMQTAAGQMIGTPAYMSPEQVSGDPDATDVRSDVYSLGVILFELLSGKLPHNLTGKPLAEAARIIRDEEPSRLTAVSRTFRGDLDIIVSKSLAKEKSRRYDSAAELAADIRRYLSGEAILARRDSAMYILTRTLRRYRFAAAAAVAFLVLLTTFAIWAAFSASANRQLARDEAFARGQAEAASKRAVESAEQALSEARRADAARRASNIQRGRVLGLTADRAAGEALLWLEHFRNPDASDTFWALRGFYQRNPCLAAVPSPARSPWSLAIQHGPAAPRDPIVAVGGLHNDAVYLYDARSGRPLSSFRPGSIATTGLAFGPDPRVLYVASNIGCLSTWTIDSTGQARLLRAVDAPHGREIRIACSPDGHWLATTDFYGRIMLWNADTLTPIGSFESPARVIGAVTFAPDSRSFYFAENTGRVWVFPVTVGQPLTSFTPPHDGGSIALSPDGSLLVVGGSQRKATLLDACTLEALSTLDVASGTIRHALFIDSGLTLVTVSWWTTDFWDVSDPARPVRTRSFAGGPSPGVRGVITDDQSIMIVSQDDGQLRFWDLAADSAFSYIESPSLPRRTTPCVSPDGQTIALASNAGIDLWSVSSRSHLRRLHRATGTPSNASFNATGTWLAARTTGRLSCTVWNLATDGPPTGFESPSGTGYVHRVRVSPDGTRAAASFDGGGVRIWDIATQRPLGDHHLTTRVPGLEFSPDGTKLYACCSESVAALDAFTAVPIRTIAANADRPYSMGINRAGTILGTGEWSRTIGLFETATLKRLGTLQGHNAMPWSVGFSSDDTMLISGGDDGRIKLWNVASGENVFTLDIAEDRINYAAFADSDRAVVFNDRDSRPRMFDTTHFDRHIAGNAEFQLGAAWASLTPTERTRAVDWTTRRIGHTPALPTNAAIRHELDDAERN